MALEMRDELLAGRYRKLETIGVGGMAKVYLAEDVRLGRRVAVKRLHSDSPEDAAERFEREAKLGASLNHPNLVSIFDIATDGESVLIVMEYVEGDTLRDAISAGPMPVDEALETLGDVAAALDHAHAHGVVHRDVKPANILRRPDGAAKLADLGIATAAENTRITRSGMVLGTAAYMAPEQLDGRDAGAAADVYSLATVAFEALSGKKARGGSTPMEVAHRIVSDPAPDLRDSWADAPDGAAEVLQRAMSQRPGDRPASAGELVAELGRALAAPAPPIADPPVPEPTAPTPKPRAAPARDPQSSIPRAPAFRASRRLPAWIPAAVVLIGFCLIGAIVLATSGGGDGGGGGKDRGNARAERPRTGTGEKKGSGAGETEGGSTAAPAPATGRSGQAQGTAGGSGTGAGAAALNSQGYRLMLAGQYDEAIPILQRAVAAYPSGSKDLTYAYALYNLGRSLRLAGRPEEAVTILERRLQIPNQTATVRRELEAARRAAG